MLGEHATLRENFLKMCNSIHLGEYFDQILYYNCFYKVTSIEQYDIC